jgi:hypothetical protein
MDRPTKSYDEIKKMLGNASTAWELLLGNIRYSYVIDEKWAEGKPTHKHFNNLFIRCSSKPLLSLHIRDGSFIVSITLGKAEREKFDEIRESFSENVLDEYDKAEILHDGKWFGFEIHDTSLVDDIIRLISVKRKPNRRISPKNIEKCGQIDIGLSKDELTNRLNDLS